MNVTFSGVRFAAKPKAQPAQQPKQQIADQKKAQYPKGAPNAA